ncbi:MAG: DNA-protecting protein DprA, partial [Candidatus Eremiobacteraeota bacterium]|nr:DNA-protecting protein DprA [Candidatus Eremiobacteraeota bacterium]
LIRDGATLARDADDVLAALPNAPLRGVQRQSQAASPLLPDDPPIVLRILDALADRTHDAADLADKLGVPPAALFAQLTELELTGRIVVGAGGFAIAPR